MKKIVLLALLAGTVSFASAQFKPTTGSNGIMFGTTGINVLGVGTLPQTNTLLLRHYLADDMAVRAGINLAINSASTPSMGGGDSLKASTTNFAILGGIQKNLGGTDRLNVYGAGDLTIGFGSAKTETTAGGNLTTVKPGSTFNLGLTGSVGFEYFIAKSWSVGAEFGYGLMMTSTGEGEITTTAPASTVKTPKSSTFGLAPSAGGGITMAVYF